MTVLLLAKHGIGYAPPEAFDLYGIGTYIQEVGLVAEESKISRLVFVSR